MHSVIPWFLEFYLLMFSCVLDSFNRMYLILLDMILFCYRKLCCNTVRSLFMNESKHGGQATGEAVRLIADHVKVHNCQMHPDSVEVCK